MKKRAAALLCLCVLALTGCAGRIELCLMAVCLGVDVGPEGVTLTVKCPDYTGSGQEDPSGYLTLSASGPDWPRAVEALMAAAPAQLHFGQLREAVISRDSFAHLPAPRLLALIDRLPSVRSHAMAAVCPGTARKYIENTQPLIGKRLSKYLDITLQHSAREGSIPSTSLACALRDAGNGWRDPLLAWAAPGGEAGACALGAAGQITLFTAEETQLYHLIRGESQGWLLPWAGRYYGVTPRRAAHLSIEETGGRTTLVLRLPVTIVYSEYEEAPGPGAAAALEEAAAALLRRLQAGGCDALGYGCVAVRKYRTLQDWQGSDWPRRYREADVRVEAEARYRQQRLL